MKKYNLYELILEIENIALQHPLVDSFYYGKEYLDHDDSRYPAFVVTTDNIRVGDTTTQVTMNFLYADRLTETESNSTQTQSVAVDVLTEIVNILREGRDMNVSADLNFHLLRNQYADNLAGAFINGITFDMASNIGRCAWFNPEKRCGS